MHSKRNSGYDLDHEAEPKDRAIVSEKREIRRLRRVNHIAIGDIQ